MKVTMILNGKFVDTELTTKQARELGLAECKTTGWEKAENGHNYYYINKKCGVDTTPQSYSCDDIQFDTANYFTNKSLAEKMAKRISLMLRIQKWADECNMRLINWDNYSQDKYYIDYNHSAKELSVFEARTYRGGIFQVHFTTKDLAQQAIEIFGDEIKEVLEYKTEEVTEETE